MISRQKIQELELEDNTSIVPSQENLEQEFWFFGEVSEYFKALISAVSEAKKSIRLCFFTFQDGRVARELVAVLIEKAKSGVEVSLLVDSIGMMADEIRFGFLSHALLKELFEAGVKTRVMRIVSPGRRIPIFPFGRLHSKLTVIDDQQLFTGGSNIGDWYLGTVDSNMTIKGSIAKDYADYFDYLFSWSAQKTDELPLPLEKISWTKKIKQKIKKVKTRRRFNGHYLASKEQASLLITFPQKRRDIRRALISDLMTARELIQIRTWIFVPDPLLLWIMGQKAKSGVKVQIMRSEKCKVFLANFAADFCDAWLRKRGVEIYHYHRAPFHAKSWLCDDIVTLGNANIDWMSLLGNHETMLRLSHPDAGKQMKEFFDSEKQVANPAPEIPRSPVKSFLSYLFFWGM